MDCERRHQPLPFAPFSSLNTYSPPHLLPPLPHGTHNLAQSCVMWSIRQYDVKTVSHQHTHMHLVLHCGWLLPNIFWFIITYNRSTISWKVGQKSAKLYVTAVCILVCSFVSVCMYVRSKRKKRRRSESMCETQMGQRAQWRGTPIGPRIPPSSTQHRGTTMAFVGHPVDLTHS